MSVPTDAVFEIPDEGDNEGPRPHDGGDNQAFVDDDNVPQPRRSDTDAPEAQS